MRLRLSQYTGINYNCDLKRMKNVYHIDNKHMMLSWFDHSWSYLNIIDCRLLLYVFVSSLPPFVLTVSYPDSSEWAVYCWIRAQWYRKILWKQNLLKNNFKKETLLGQYLFLRIAYTPPYNRINNMNYKWVKGTLIQNILLVFNTLKFSYNFYKMLLASAYLWFPLTTRRYGDSPSP